MKVELHCHTHYSKGTKLPCEGIDSPRMVVRYAKKIGLGGIAITDHKVTKAWKEAREECRKLGMLFIPGEEVETREGHILALGIGERIKNSMNVEETVDAIHEAGGIAVAPHPFDIKGDGVGEKIKYVDAVEVFNSLSIDRIGNMLAAMKRGGKPGVAGSDAHMKEMVGLSLNFVQASDVDGVLSEVKKGRVRWVGRYVSTDVLLTWVRKRMRGSFEFLMEYTKRNYNPIKGAVARYLLKGYLRTGNYVWKPITYSAVLLTEVYALARMFHYMLD